MQPGNTVNHLPLGVRKKCCTCCDLTFVLYRQTICVIMDFTDEIWTTICSNCLYVVKVLAEKNQLRPEQKRYDLALGSIECRCFNLLVTEQFKSFII